MRMSQIEIEIKKRYMIGYAKKNKYNERKVRKMLHVMVSELIPIVRNVF